MLLVNLMYEHQIFVYVNERHRIINMNDIHLLLIYVNNNFFQLNVLIVIEHLIFLQLLILEIEKESTMNKMNIYVRLIDMEYIIVTQK